MPLSGPLIIDLGKMKACHQVKTRTWVQFILTSGGLGTGKGSCDHLEEPDKAGLRALCQRKEFFSFGGGSADPRWTTTLLTASDSRSEARVLKLEA